MNEDSKCFKVLRTAGFVIDEKEKKTFPPDTFYWMVTQDENHYEIERDGNYIWSPKKRKNGSRNPFWDNMALVKKGDIIAKLTTKNILAPFSGKLGTRGISSTTLGTNSIILTIEENND